jgi:hypothetical protein
MSYVSETLAPGETVLTRARFNWTYSIDAVFWFVVGLLPLIGTAVAHAGGDLAAGAPIWLYGFSGLAALLGTGVLIAHIIHLQTTEIAVTSSRFIYKTGLVSRTTKEVSLNKIEEINLEQSILGRIFGYGHLTLRGTGVGVIELPDIDNPLEIRRTIEGAKARLREAPDDRSNARPAPPDEPMPAPPAPAVASAKTAPRPPTSAARGQVGTAPAAGPRQAAKPARTSKPVRTGKPMRRKTPPPDLR